MPLLPKAHAASLLKRDDAGRMLFFPVSDEKTSYVIPDAEAEKRIFGQLKRIRFAQLAAWTSLPAALIEILVITDGKIPKWLFLLLFVGAAMAIQFVPDWARHRLAHGLDLASEHAPKPSLIEKLPLWALIIVVGMAVGLAVYFARAWPLRALTWFDELGPAVLGSKALAQIAVLIGGVAAMLWAGVGMVRKWLRPSGNPVAPIGTDEKT